jgi:hypothetical protein
MAENSGTDKVGRSEQGGNSAEGNAFQFLVTGVPILGCLAVGVAGFIYGVRGCYYSGGAESALVGPGLCLIASSLAFGLLANAVWRK